ncbi:uncharacterized protein [Dermacentor andersoni]|uniref:uncharacterized protein n=1 Tax=Dermacentor andersoni TaxID=34620 RepID=UPI0024164DFB|nr:uncharacterized protein LOC126534059 isoform X2 [Dermacentor andersoni]
MVGKALFTTVVLLASVPFVTLNDVFKCAPNLCKKLDMRKFVGTREPIWTWNTTAKEDISCKVDVMKSLAEGSILFTRKFHISSELRPIAENYEGIFLKKQQNVMQLREPGHNFMAKETILYHSGRYHCAVIRVTPTLSNMKR